MPSRIANNHCDEQQVHTILEHLPSRAELDTEFLYRAVQKAAMADDWSDLPGLSQVAAGLEPSTRRAFIDAVTQTRNRVELEALAEAIQAGQVTRIEALLQLDFLQQELHRNLRAPIINGFLRGAQFANSTIQAQVGTALRFDLINPHAVSFAERYVPQLASSIVQGGQERVQQIIVEAVQGNLTAQSAARRIRDSIGLTRRDSQFLDRFEQQLRERGIDTVSILHRVEKMQEALIRRRSLVIARTELIRAANGGQQALWMESLNQGLISKDRTQRKWIVTHDDRLDVQVCILQGTRVLTMDGWKAIQHIMVGDYVLTHCDRFRRVTATAVRQYTGPSVRIIGGHRNIKVHATYGHLVLTQRGWVPIEGVIDTDYIAVNGIPCAGGCGLILPIGPRHVMAQCVACQAIFSNRIRWADVKQHERLSHQNNVRWAVPGARESQSRKFQLHNPSTRPEVKLQLANRQRERIQAGDHHLFTPEALFKASQRMSHIASDPIVQQKRMATVRRRQEDPTYQRVQATALLAAIKKNGDRLRARWQGMDIDARRQQISRMLAGNTKVSKGRSTLERRLTKWLSDQQIPYLAQWPFTYVEHGVVRQGFADFYIPGSQVVIECDGYFHFRDVRTRQRDVLRDHSLKNMGITVLRFEGKQIMRRFHEVASLLRQYCCITWMKPKRLEHTTIARQSVYDLTVEDDHSFIAGGVVVHNCEPMDQVQAGLTAPFVHPYGLGEFMHPPAHPQCRCAIVLVFSE